MMYNGKRKEVCNKFECSHMATRCTTGCECSCNECLNNDTCTSKGGEDRQINIKVMYRFSCNLLKNMVKLKQEQNTLKGEPVKARFYHGICNNYSSGNLIILLSRKI